MALMERFVINVKAEKIEIEIQTYTETGPEKGES